MTNFVGEIEYVKSASLESGFVVEVESEGIGLRS